jgi:hypothetical protein
MEFGRGQKIDNVNFALPADAVMTDRVLQSVRGRDEPLRLWVGGTGWGQAKWVGKVYPRGTRPKDFLSHYVRQFNSIELNALWYNLQPKAVIGRWASLAGPGFRFCPKFSNTISHERLLEGLLLGFRWAGRSCSCRRASGHHGRRCCMPIFVGCRAHSGPVWS